MHTHWQVIRLSDRMQAKPFTVFIHLPHYTISLLPICHYPEVHQTVTRGPRGSKACRTMTTDLWRPVSKAPPHHHCMFSFLFTVSMHLLHSLLLCFFYFVSLHPTALCDSGCWLKQSPLKLAVPVSPVFSFDPKARDLHQGVECLQPPQRIFWRTASRPLCDGPMS